MFEVGDAVRHAAFLAALGRDHGYRGRVQSFYAGELAGEVEFESGAVKVTSANRERRSLDDLVVAEKLWPTAPTDPLSPYGQWLLASVDIHAGATVYGPIPVFAGRVLDVERIRWSGRLTVSAVDPMWQVNREHFETLRRAPEGMLIPHAILMLLREVFPDATLQDTTGTTVAVPAEMVWNAGKGSRGKAVDELAAAIGAEVIARPTAVWPGGDFLLRPIPSFTDPVVWTLPDGAASIVESDRLVQSSADVVNRWIVTAEQQDGPTVSVPATDDNPSSPTRYGGPMGKLVDFYSSNAIRTADQAALAGQAKLRRSIGLARPRSVTVPANPALDGGDVLEIGVDQEAADIYIADDFVVPLTYDPASMTIDTRWSGGPE